MRERTRTEHAQRHSKPRRREVLPPDYKRLRHAGRAPAQSVFLPRRRER